MNANNNDPGPLDLSDITRQLNGLRQATGAIPDAMNAASAQLTGVRQAAEAVPEAIRSAVNKIVTTIKNQGPPVFRVNIDHSSDLLASIDQSNQHLVQFLSQIADTLADQVQATLPLASGDQTSLSDLQATIAAGHTAQVTASQQLSASVQHAGSSLATALVSALDSNKIASAENLAELYELIQRAGRTIAVSIADSAQGINTIQAANGLSQVDQQESIKKAILDSAQDVVATLRGLQINRNTNPQVKSVLWIDLFLFLELKNICFLFYSVIYFYFSYAPLLFEYTDLSINDLFPHFITYSFTL